MTRGRRGHLSAEVALDFLEGRLQGRKLEEVEAHLGAPCAACRERLRALASVVDRMRADRLADVPDHVTRRALEVFRPVPAAAPAPGVLGRWLELVFDSLRAPLPAATRRAVGDVRRLRFAGESWSLELECEREDGDRIAVRGRLTGEDPSLQRIEVTIGAERFEAWPDAEGRFALDALPRGPVAIELRGPAGAWRVPAFEP